MRVDQEFLGVKLNAKMLKPLQRNPAILKLLPPAYLTKPGLSPDRLGEDEA